MFFGRVKGGREGDDDSKFPPPPTPPPPPEEEADSILAALAKVMGNQETTHIADIIGDLLLPCSLSCLFITCKGKELHACASPSETVDCPGAPNRRTLLDTLNLYNAL